MLQKIKDTIFWNIPLNEVEDILNTDLQKGISESEASERLAHYGKNTIESSKRTGAFKIFLSQLKSPLIIVLIIAGVITLSISHFRDSAFIFIAVIVNSILGFYQENKAERALSELKTYLKQKTRVVRDGIEKEVDAETIVPGDVIRLAQGDRVPADARILLTNDIQIDEAILTGESLPVSKQNSIVPENTPLEDRVNIIFAGTLVTQGVCNAIVYRTEKSTELGKIATLIAEAEKESTPLQAAIKKFSLKASMFLGLLTLVIFIIGVSAGYSSLEMFLISVAIAVSAIPEGLPISLTVILAVGVVRMAKRKGVVRKLVAAETLGSTTVILTDKTGTLTMAKMVMSRVISFGIDEEKLLLRALTNANVLIENPTDIPEEWRMNGRIMEKSLVQSAALRGIALADIVNKKNIIESLPFNAIQKFSASLINEQGSYVIVFFGAPDILIEHSLLNTDEQKALLKQIESYAISGERVLGVASKTIPSLDGFQLKDKNFMDGLSLDGLVTFKDPIRSGIRDTLKQVEAAGIKTVIMTGDHRGTAIAVAKEIGLKLEKHSVLDASELISIPEDVLKERLRYVNVISRVTPFDKLRIAKLFQENGEIAAMTGDGVNDAPSIKQVDVGIAMGSGTEVAQSVADLVLLDDNFQTIVAAIEEGRQILSNIRKVLVYLLSNVTDGLILIGGSLLMGVPLPLNALQILWVNFFTDSFPAISFAFEKESNGLNQKPRNIKTGLFDPLMKFLILVIGITTSALLFVIYITLLKLGHDERLVRTFIFAAFGTYTLFVAFPVRSLEKSMFSINFFSNKYLSAGVLAGLALMIAAVYVPILQSLFDTVSLPPIWVLGVLCVGIFNIALIESAKWIFRKKQHSKIQLF